MRAPSRISGARDSSLTSSQGLCVLRRRGPRAGPWARVDRGRTPPLQPSPPRTCAIRRDRAPAPDGLGRLRQKTDEIQLPRLGRRAWLERIWISTPLAVGGRSSGSSRNGAPCVVAPDQRPQLVRRLGLQHQAVVPADGPEIACARDLVGVAPVPAQVGKLHSALHSCIVVGGVGHRRSLAQLVAPRIDS